MNKAFLEMAKEGARIAFFGALAALISWASTKVAHLDPTSVYAIVGTLVLRLADKYVHNNKDIKLNGLAPL